MSINQLLSKALSTTSEEEAMACLRMARKKGGRLDDSSGSSEYNGHDAKYWYDKAYRWYHEAKKREDFLSPEQQRHLFRMYESERDDVIKLRREKRGLEDEIRKLKDRPTGWWKVPLILLQAGVILALVQLIG